MQKLYYYQGHYTAIGVRDVEKPGKLWDRVTPRFPYLYLPVSKEIEKHLLLVSEPVFREEKQEDGTIKEVTEWTDWYLLEVPAAEVAPDKPLVLPPFDEIVANADIDPDLLETLRSMYETARIAAEKKANTPVKNQWEQPWYTW